MFVILAHHNFLRILLSYLSEVLVPVEFQVIEHISNDLGKKGNPNETSEQGHAPIPAGDHEGPPFPTQPRSPLRIIQLRACLHGLG